jgi:hypothetical protein
MEMLIVSLLRGGYFEEHARNDFARWRNDGLACRVLWETMGLFSDLHEPSPDQAGPAKMCMPPNKR